MDTVLETARKAGWLKGEPTEISALVNGALVNEARRRTGLASNSELIEYALASIILDHDFADAFRRVKGSVDPDVKLGY